MLQQKEAAYYILVNPNAGGKKGKKIWKAVSKVLAEKKIQFDYATTHSRGHGIELTREAIANGYRKILVLGGDGTLNEAVNGIFQQDACPTNEITLGIIPVGTGNDLGRMYGIPKDSFKALDIILKNNTFTQDVAKVSFFQNGVKCNRYFANCAGMGYDALVTRKSNLWKDNGYTGIWVYWTNILLSLFQHKCVELEIEVDGVPSMRSKVYSMSVGICKYSGGGVPQLPNAIPDDGLMDMTVVKRINILKILGNLPRLFNGSFIHMKEIKTFQAKSIGVKTVYTKPLYLETDGESLGTSPCDFTLIPKSLNIYVA